MVVKTLKIKGLRGFTEETTINFAIPDGVNFGSGLTVLVGPNNSGKSTVIEAMHILTNHNNIIPISARNSKGNGIVTIEMENEIGDKIAVHSTDNRGAFVQRTRNDIKINGWENYNDTFILSSKRSFSSTFSNTSGETRENYKGNTNSEDYRSENGINNNFGGRLMKIYSSRQEFETCLEKVLFPVPNWTIEADNSNNLFLEFEFEGIKHSSKGAGDGYINIFNIVDALYDSREKNVILIDEPEVSLHPDLQRKLFQLLVEHSKDKQIIISTHSPYFVDWHLFSEYSKIIRFKKCKDNIKTYELSNEGKTAIRKIIKDKHQPHTLSLDANEIFFLNDNVILTEGQEDVLCYRGVFNNMGYMPKASLFGWGAGGAPKVEFILCILKDLGYNKVFTILDGDQKGLLKKLSKKYIEYGFYAIKANDVRNKDRDARIDKVIEKIQSMKDKDYTAIIELVDEMFKNKIGLVKNIDTCEINEIFIEDVNELLEQIKNYFDNEQEEIKRYNTPEIDNDESEELQAQEMLAKWIDNNSLRDYIEKKYRKFEFKMSGGGQTSFKKVKEHKYYVILQYGVNISMDQGITISYHIVIDTKKQKIKLKKRQIIENTLPVSNVEKIIQKIFN